MMYESLTEINDAFDIFFIVFFGIWQFGFALGGAFMLLIGAVIIYDFFSWRSGADKYLTQGDIIGLRVSGRSISAQEEDEEEIAAKLEEQARQRVKPAKPEGFFTKAFGGFFALLFVLMFLGVPTAFFGFGAYTAFDYHKLQKDGGRAPATVSGYESYYDSDSGTTYNAIISYTDHAGHNYQEQDGIGGGKKKFTVGQQVSVIYDKTNPAHFYIDDYWHNMTIAYVFIGISSLFFFLIFGGFNLIADKFKGTKHYTSAPQKKRHQENYDGEMYYAVIEYVTRDGQRVRASTNSGSSSLRNKIPGSRIQIIASKKDPESVRRRTTLWLWIGLIIGIGPGVGLLTLAFAKGISPFFFVILAFFVLKKGPKIYKIWAKYKALSPEEQEEKKDAFAKKKITRKAKRNAGPLLDKYDVQDRLRFYAARARISAFILLIMAGGVLTLAYNMDIDFYQNIITDPQSVLDFHGKKLKEDQVVSLVVGVFGVFLSIICIQSYLASRTKRF